MATAKGTNASSVPLSFAFSLAPASRPIHARKVSWSYPLRPSENASANPTASPAKATDPTANAGPCGRNLVLCAASPSAMASRLPSIAVAATDAEKMSSAAYTWDSGAT